MHVYRKNRSGDEWLFTVGYYAPVSMSGMTGVVGTSVSQWIPLEDTSREEEARQLVNYLNGGDGRPFRYAREPMVVVEDDE
jgi:hypothetical protein